MSIRMDRKIKIHSRTVLSRLLVRLTTLNTRIRVTSKFFNPYGSTSSINALLNTVETMPMTVRITEQRIA